MSRWWSTSATYSPRPVTARPNPSCRGHGCGNLHTLSSRLPQPCPTGIFELSGRGRRAVMCSPGNRATGGSRRSRANSSDGTARAHMSRSVRSTARSIVNALGAKRIGRPWHAEAERMRVLIIRHHGVDSAGFIGDAFEARDAALDIHLLPDDGPLPALDGVDHVVVLGAVSSVNDPDPWIAEELAWLHATDSAGVPMLGICFGAQALCVALGGRVEAMERKEIGWTLVESADHELIPVGPWLEFHGDRCLPPATASVWRTTTPGCRRSGSAGTSRSSSIPRSTAAAQALAGRGRRRRRRTARARRRPVPGRHHPRGAGRAGAGRRPGRRGASYLRGGPPCGGHLLRSVTVEDIAAHSVSWQNCLPLR